MTPDRIEISALRLVASVGVLPEEHERPQPLELSLSVEVLADTVNYADLIDEALRVAGSRHHELLESLSDEIGRAVLGVDSRIEAVTVSTTKLRPPIGADVATVGVRRRCVR